MCIINTTALEVPSSKDGSSSERNQNMTTCDEVRSQCDRLYSALSTVEEDCKTYRIYLGCLSMLKITQTLCQADFHYLMMLSTTEKLITEKCSPGDTSPIEPPREIFNYPISPSKTSKGAKLPSLSPCLDPAGEFKTPYHSCALFGHPNLVTFSGERQTCRLQGAWPLVNNRYISVQISGQQHNQFHFRDPSASVIHQISIILKPDGKCLGDLVVPTLVYVASAYSTLSVTFLNNRKEMHQSMMSIKSLHQGSKSQDGVDLWFGYISTRIFITRTLVSQGQFTLSVSVLLPSQVSMAKPRSKQQSLVRELCSLGCSPPESVDDLTLLSRPLPPHTAHPPSTSSHLCLGQGLEGVFFDVCYLMSRLLLFTNSFTPQSSEVRNPIERYILTSTKHAQNNIVEFSKMISDNFSLDLSQRTRFRPFRPLWKMRQLDASAAAQSQKSKRSSTISLNVSLTLLLPLMISVF